MMQRFWKTTLLMLGLSAGACHSAGADPSAASAAAALNGNVFTVDSLLEGAQAAQAAIRSSGGANTRSYLQSIVAATSDDVWSLGGSALGGLRTIMSTHTASLESALVKYPTLDDLWSTLGVNAAISPSRAGLLEAVGQLLDQYHSYGGSLTSDKVATSEAAAANLSALAFLSLSGALSERLNLPVHSTANTSEVAKPAELDLDDPPTFDPAVWDAAATLIAIRFWEHGR